MGCGVINNFGVLTLMGKDAEMLRYCLLGKRDPRLMKFAQPLSLIL